MARTPNCGGEALMFVNVDLADFDLALIFAGQFIQHGRDHLARPAPFGPEIHQHGRGGFQGFRFKIVLRERNDQRRGHNH